MDAPFPEILQNAWDRRAALRARTQAYRLLNGAASGTPGLAVDVFGDCLAVYAYAAELPARYPGLAEALRKVTGAAGAALKDRAAPDESGREEGGVLFGEVPETVDVRERAASGPAAPGGLAFRIHPRHPRNVGLFLDTRPLRGILLSTCAGAEVLNLFSYSCSLGAAAAGGGAASVVNVDISARYLGWGRENFALSGLPEEGMRFTRMDSEEYLDWAARKGKAFDVVVLDPPSFSRARGKGAKGGNAHVFAFEKDYFRLLGKAAGRLKPGGRVYAVTNFGGIAPDRFREGVAEAVAAAAGARPRLRAVPLPEDFDPGPDGLAPRTAREGAYLAVEAAIPGGPALQGGPGAP